MKKLKVGLIGTGFIGKLYARILSETVNANLVSVCDVDENSAKEIAEKYLCSFYKNYKEMFSKENLDAVCICTPDEYHAEVAISAANNGLDILLEKPVAQTYDESVKIAEAVKNANRRLMIGHVLKFDPRYAKLQEAIDNGEFGEIIHMYFRRTNPRENCRRLGGKVSIFYYIGVHDFEMLCSYARSEPIRVYSQMVSKVNKDINCEDTVFSIINFEDGSIGMIELSWALPNNSALGINAYVEVAGRKSVGYINIMDQGLSIINEKNLYYADTLHWPQYNNMIMGDLKEEIHHFVNATLESKPYLVNTDNAIKAVKVIEGCFESIKANMPVEIK